MPNTAETSPREPIERALNEGDVLLMVIEVEGARQIKEQFPDALLIFIEPPSFEEAIRRISRRESESEEELRRRLERAKKEMEAARFYDYRVVNDKLDEAVEEVRTIIERERKSRACKASNSKEV